jgi:hypothetical protein
MRRFVARRLSWLLRLRTNLDLLAEVAPAVARPAAHQIQAVDEG